MLLIARSALNIIYIYFSIS